jgi:limonene-1,2-epoxide hydrolase
MADAERFLERFRAFGRDPSPESYEQLFDPEEGTVLHPGMTEPLPRSQVGKYIAGVLSTLKEFRFEITASCAAGDRVFAEARNSAIVGGERVEWDSVYSIVLRGDRVLRGRAYFDRIPVLARLAPALPLGEANAMPVTVAMPSRRGEDRGD